MNYEYGCDVIAYICDYVSNAMFEQQIKNY